MLLIQKMYLIDTCVNVFVNHYLFHGAEQEA